MKNVEIKELSTKDLIERIAAEKDNLVKMKLSHVVSPLEHPAQLREARKTIARMQTILRQREINEKK